MIEFYMRSCLKLLTKKNVENPFIITNIGSHPSCQIECKNICQDICIYIYATGRTKRIWGVAILTLTPWCRCAIPRIG
jgi:hypothetical protein